MKYLSTSNALPSLRTLSALPVVAAVAFVVWKLSSILPS